MYPYDTVTLCASLVKLLEDQGRSKEAKESQKVMDARLSAFALAGVTVDADVQARWFIQVLQTADGKIIDHCDVECGEDQNIGLLDIVNQYAMCRTDTTQKVTISGVMDRVGFNVSVLLVLCQLSLDLEQSCPGPP